MENMERLVLTVPEAAELLGISKSHMYQLARTAGFPTVQIGKRTLVSAKGLEKWVERQAQIGWQDTRGNLWLATHN